MTIQVAAITHFPVKGLSSQTLARAALAPGQGLPDDRRFALSRGTGPSALITRAEHPRLALLESTFEAENAFLTIRRGGKPVARGTITDPVGKAVIEQFFAAFLGFNVRIVELPPPPISLVLAETVADLERLVGDPVDPRRLRANILLAGGRQWQEFEWIGTPFRLGSAEFLAEARIPRGQVENINPDTGSRDLLLQKALQSGFGHSELGVYARIVTAGEIALGNALG